MKPLIDFDEERARDYQRRGHLFIPAYDTFHDLTLALLERSLGKSAQVLAVGTGWGKELVTLALAQPDWKLTGLDPSAAMVGLARQTLTQNGLAGRVTLVESQVADLPPVPTYDAITCLLVLHFLSPADQVNLLRQMALRLNPGGELVVVTLFGDPDTTEFHRQLDAWGKQAFRSGWGSLEEIQERQERRRRDLHWLSEDQITHMLWETGFHSPRRFFQALVVGGWIARKA